MTEDLSPPEPVPVDAVGPWSHRLVSANGARFHVAETGEGPLVLLLHGFPLFWWTWREVLPGLAEAGYRAAAMDLRGYGGSDKTPRGYDPFTLSADVAGVVRSLGATDAVVVGHGWGGFIGWTAAVLEAPVVRGLVAVAVGHPRQMRAALLTSPRQVAASSYLLGFQRPWAPERQLVRDDAAAVGALLHDWSATDGWPDPTTEVSYRRAVATPGVAHSALEYYRWMVRSIPRPDGLRFAGRMRSPVEAPVLHLLGEHDPVLLPPAFEGSQGYVAAEYRRELLDCGHFLHEERPAEFRDLLLDWLAGKR